MNHGETAFLFYSSRASLKTHAYRILDRLCTTESALYTPLPVTLPGSYWSELYQSERPLVIAKASHHLSLLILGPSLTSGYFYRSINLIPELALSPLSLFLFTT